MVGTSSTPRNFARSFLRHLTSSWGGSQEVCGPTRRCPTCPGAPLKPPPSSPSLRVSLSRCSSPTPSPSRPRWRKRFFRRRSIRGLRGLEILNNNLCGMIAKSVTRLRRGYAGYVWNDEQSWVSCIIGCVICVWEDPFRMTRPTFWHCPLGGGGGFYKCSNRSPKKCPRVPG